MNKIKGEMDANCINASPYKPCVSFIILIAMKAFNNKERRKS